MLKELECSVDERRKQRAALVRAVPVTRMLDYGVPLADALAVHAAGSSEDPPGWDLQCEGLALRHIGFAQSGQAPADAESQAWRAAAALLQCAQLAFNEDNARKKDLYERAQDAMRRHAALSGDLAPLVLDSAQGELHGWVVSPMRGDVQAAVLVLGGLSGWGAVYLDMGRALAARGVLAVIGEGPGQGLTRLRSGIHLDAVTLPMLGRFLDHAQTLTRGPLGVWGNSFGGLFAAGLAVRDKRVAALCVNGAPMRPTVPSYRTAREQMQGVFGTTAQDRLAQRVGAMALDPARDRTDAAILVVQGGRDELVPMGEQASFHALTSSSELSTLSWSDGEHTIYNHAAERNRKVADWFAQQLCDGKPG